MSEYYDEVPLSYPSSKPPISDEEHVGQGWSVCASGGRYYFTYISGELAGKMKEIEIAKPDFEQAKAGKMGFDKLCRTYNVS
jgi:hypothetical protein